MEPLKLKRHSDLHLARKSWHMTTVMGIVFIHLYVPPNIIDFILIGAWILCLTIELSRLKYKSVNRIMISIFGVFMRKKEIYNLTGLTYLLAGVTLLHLVFPYNISTLSLLFLCFADPIASYIGIRFGKKKILGKKTWAGFWGAFGVSLIASVIFFNVYDIQTSIPIIPLILAGLVGAISEVVSSNILDDNLVIPVLSATLLLGLFEAFAGGAF